MNFSTSTLFLLSTAVSAAKGFVTPSVFATVGSSPTSLSGTATAVERETFQRSLLAAKLANDKVGGLKKAGEDAPPVSLGWDSHNYVDQAPDTLVRPGDGPDGNYPMRARFEKMLREAQISITDAIV
jgi:hypothetical protein